MFRPEPKASRCPDRVQRDPRRTGGRGSVSRVCDKSGFGVPLGFPVFLKPAPKRILSVDQTGSSVACSLISRGLRPRKERGVGSFGLPGGIPFLNTCILKPQSSLKLFYTSNPWACILMGYPFVDITYISVGVHVHPWVPRSIFIVGTPSFRWACRALQALRPLLRLSRAREIAASKWQPAPLGKHHHLRGVHADALSLFLLSLLLLWAGDARGKFLQVFCHAQVGSFPLNPQKKRCLGSQS